MKKLCVLVANHPRAYREAIAAALRLVRPHIEVVVADDLDHDLVCLAPDVVLCSSASAALHGVRAWVDLYPDGASTSTIFLDGVRRNVDAVTLPDLVRFVAEVEHVCRSVCETA